MSFSSALLLVAASGMAAVASAEARFGATRSLLTGQYGYGEEEMPAEDGSVEPDMDSPAPTEDSVGGVEGVEGDGNGATAASSAVGTVVIVAAVAAAVAVAAVAAMVGVAYKRRAAAAASAQAAGADDNSNTTIASSAI